MSDYKLYIEPVNMYSDLELQRIVISFDNKDKADVAFEILERKGKPMIIYKLYEE